MTGKPLSVAIWLAVYPPPGLLTGARSLMNRAAPDAPYATNAPGYSFFI